MAGRANTMGAAEALEQFVTAINGHDLKALAALMTTDHTFVDSAGNRVRGATVMEAGWRSYFAMCPDYWIRADHVVADGNTALAAGEAGGTIDDVEWRTHAAWRALVDEGKVVEWQVFADNKPVYDILARRHK